MVGGAIITATKKNLISSALIILLAIWVFIESGNYPEEVRMLPRAMAVSMFLFSVPLLYMSLIKIKNSKTIVSGTERESWVSGIWPKLGAVLLIWFFFLSLITKLGFYVAMFVFWIAITWFLEGKRDFKMVFAYVPYSFVVITVLYLFFNVFIKIPTPKGVLF